VAKRRRRNSGRKWLWIGLGAAAATTVAVVAIRRYREAPDAGESGVDGSTYDASAAQIALLCSSPGDLTVDDRTILIANVFAPAWSVYVSQNGQPQGPSELLRAQRLIARRVLRDGCGATHPRIQSVKAAVGLVDGGRMLVEGHSEQG